MTDRTPFKPRFAAAHMYASLGIPVFPINRIVTAKDGSLECECEAWRRKRARLNGEAHSPCDAPGKHGKLKSWKTSATTDPTQIDLWLKEWPHANIGAVTGNGLIVFDIDGAEGEASLVALVAEHGELPPTVTVKTGGGGSHYWFRLPEGVDVRNSTTGFGPKIDIRGSGGYVVVPPSNHKSGGIYSFVEGRGIDEIEMAIAPDWLIRRANSHDKRETEVARGADRTKSARQAAKPRGPGSGFAHHLSCIGDAEGQEGFDGPINRAALAFLGEHGPNADLSELKKLLNEAISAAYEDPANPRKDSKYLTDAYLDRRIEQAREHIGKSKTVAKRLESAGQTIFKQRDELVEAINSQFALAVAGSKAIYIHEDGDDVRLLNKQAAQDLLAPYQLASGDSDPRPGFDVWLRSPKRRLYSQIVFEPGKDVPRAYNLWRGFAVEPNDGSCELFLKLVYEVVCKRDPDLYHWVIAWLANSVQDPGRKPGTALVLSGKKGTGKSSFAQYIRAIFGKHGKTISQPRHLTGNFNAHLADCIILHVDEGFWAGDKAGEGVIKQLITDDVMMLERKGVDATMAPNHLRMIMTTNADWAVPASCDERRFLVLDVSDEKAKDTAFFSELNRELANGGAGALLRELLAFDTTGIDLRNPPKTAALLDQMLHSLPHDVAWWHSVLDQGAFPGEGDLGDDHTPDGWPHAWGEIDTAVVYRSYHRFVPGPRGKPVNENVIGRFLKDQVPQIDKKRSTGRGGSGRKWRYLFPPLQILRDRFAELYPVEFTAPELSGFMPDISDGSTGNVVSIAAGGRH